MTDEKKPELCGHCVLIGKTTDGVPTCGFAVMDLCFDNCCKQCRLVIKHTCGWIDPAEIRAALLPYLAEWAKGKGGMVDSLDPLFIHGELLAVGILTEAVEVMKRVFDKHKAWIGIFFPKSTKWMVEFGVDQATGKPDDEARWTTSKIWYGLRDIDKKLKLRPAALVPAAVVKFWTGVEPRAWDILQV